MSTPFPLRPILLSLAILILTYPSITAGQPQIYTEELVELTGQGALYIILGQDLLQISSPEVNVGMGIDKKVASVLSDSSINAGQQMRALISLVLLYSYITEPNYKAAAREYILEEIAHISSIFQLHAETVNKSLSFAISSGLALKAANLRDEIRRGLSLVRSLSGKLH